MTANPLLELLNIELPLIQAPMAGVATPAMAAAAANAGALGSIGVGAAGAAVARQMIAAIRERSSRSFNINVFCHRHARENAAVESAWIERLRPQFESFGVEPPKRLQESYKSFLEDDEMLAMLLEEKPPVVSFHFGLPPQPHIRALRDAGMVLLASATSLHEARAVAQAGVQAIVAQGYEAGGHRGVFDPDAPDDRLGTMALTRLLVRHVDLPIIAAGGIMDGAGIAAALRLGASAAQLGTAFIATHESAADDGYRATLASDAAHHTLVTRVISGRPARCLPNRFTPLDEAVLSADVPDYPIAYDAAKALSTIAKAAGISGYGAYWAGQGAPLARSLSTADLVAQLASEMSAASF